MKKILLTTVVLLMSLVAGNAQKVKTVDGNPDAIKGDQNVNVIFTYENLKVGKMDESAYLEREIAERDAKEAGTGDEWLKKWEYDKTYRYPPKFIQLFNNYGGDYFGTNIEEEVANSKYTMKVNTSMIEPGFNVGITRRPALINQEIYVYETSNPDNILYHATILKSPGTSVINDYDTGERIKEAFAKSSKTFCKFLSKKHMK